MSQDKSNHSTRKTVIIILSIVVGISLIFVVRAVCVSATINRASQEYNKAYDKAKKDYDRAYDKAQRDMNNAMRQYGY